MRVTTELFVSALIRRVNGSGAFAVVARKGAAEAGAVFVKIRHRDGRYDLLAPAVQAAYDSDGPRERVFEKVEQGSDEATADTRLAREKGWDPDLWIVEIEDYDLPLEGLLTLAGD